MPTPAGAPADRSSRPQFRRAACGPDRAPAPYRADRRVCAATKHTLAQKEWRQYVGDIAYRPPCP
ncbi:hypothetical protein [Streptomyces sp. Ag109_O5-1]|uniref:hypothetical protein n=1 Tax=Streptomyces sp. Ag109_O5-1 TaxID=1938851 RepID=UPI000F503CAA|nr:hypothetical protein [Streptomyces sp. Ag109_O5-1]